MLWSSLNALLRLCDTSPQHMLYMTFALWKVGSALYHNRYTLGLLRVPRGTNCGNGHEHKHHSVVVQ